MPFRLLTLITSALLWSSTASGQGRDVAIAAPDNATLTATYFPAAGPGPAMLLLHQCDRTSTSWAALATALARRGVHVLAPDYRGTGANRALPLEISKLTTDLDAELDWLLSQPSVNVSRVAVGGASCGVDRAVQLARRDGTIDALLLLSGPTTASGMSYLRSARVPVFFAFSVEEGGPLPAMRDAVAASAHPDATVRELRRAGHGVEMFDNEPALLPAIVDWVVRMLR